MKILRRVLAVLCIMLLIADICAGNNLFVLAEEFLGTGDKAIEEVQPTEEAMDEADDLAASEENVTEIEPKEAAETEPKAATETEPKAATETEPKAATETEATVGAEVKEAEPAEEAKDAADQEPAEEVKEFIRTMEYEDEDVKVNVKEVTPNAIPGNATLKVVPIVEKTAAKGMTEEEIREINAINNQYKEVVEKLAEKAEKETYDIAGFLAYDITFVDQDGNKVEPNGEVKVSMDYKQAVIPEEVANADAETTDVTVMHFEEDADGQVKEIVDMVADEKTEASVQTTEKAEVEKTEFVTDSFSTFTITWMEKVTTGSGWWSETETYGAKIGINYFDTKGNLINVPKTEDITGDYSSKEEIIDLYAYKKEIPGYTFRRISKNPPTPTNSESIRRIKYESTGDYSGNVKYSAEDSGNNWTNWLNFNSSKVTGEIYIIYEKNEAEPVPPTEKTLSKEKYVKYNAEDNTYDLTLNVSGRAASAEKGKLDVLFVLDISGSMAYDMAGEWGDQLERLQEADKAINNAVNKVVKSNVDARYSLVTFSEKRSNWGDPTNANNDSNFEFDAAWNDSDIRADWTNSANELRSKLPDYTKHRDIDGQREVYLGTNYQAGLMSATALLASARSDATKVVVFVSDGNCTRYYDGTGKTAGLGFEYDKDAMTAAQNVLSKMTMDHFYTIGIGPSESYENLPTLLQKVPQGTAKKNFVGENDAQLETAFNEVITNAINSAIKFPCSNVEVTDTLSSYAEIVDENNTELQIIVKQRASTFDAEGNMTTSLTAVNPVASSGGTVKTGTSFTLPATTLNSQATLEAKYDHANKKITLKFPTDYKLEEDYIYYVKTKIKPTAEAHSEYEADKLTGGSGYPANVTGDEFTDENVNADSTGENTVNNGTSSKKAGFYANTSATVKYSYEGKTPTEDYPKPVIQVSNEVVDPGPGTTPEAGQISQQKYIKKNPNGSYDLTLNVSAPSVEESKLDIVLVLDNSVSMSNQGRKYPKYSKDKLTPMQDAATAMIDSFKSKTNVVNARWQVISFNSKAVNQPTDTSGWLTDTDTAIAAVDKISPTYIQWAGMIPTNQEEWGTNYKDALSKAATALTTARDDCEKIVVFLTDGVPESYDYSTEDSRHWTKPFFDGLDEAKKPGNFQNCNRFYAVGVDLGDKPYDYGTDDNGESYDGLTPLGVLRKITEKLPATTTATVIPAVGDKTGLSTVFDNIGNSILHNYTKVSITDTLTDYVHLEAGSTMKVTMKDANGVEQASKEVGPLGDLKREQEWKNVDLVKKDGSKVTVTVTYKPTTTDGSSGGEVTLTFPTKYALENGMVYDITMKILPTDYAYSEYAKNAKDGGYIVNGMLVEGQPGTDAPDNQPHTSEGKPGFRSNTSATLTYTYDGEESSSPYKHPVVQVETKSIEIVKTWADANNAYGLRPEKITFKIKQRVGGGDWSVYTEYTMTAADAVPKGGNVWKHTISGLPAKNGNGDELLYQVVEVNSPADYDVSYAGESQSQSQVTNTLKVSSWKLVKQNANADKDGKHETLSGAIFEIKAKDGTVYYGRSGEDGEVSFYEESQYGIWKETITLGNGAYTLQEKEAPPGYALDNTAFGMLIENGVVSVKTTEGIEKGHYDPVNDSIVITLDNTRLYELPSAGGCGIYWYSIGGMLFMMAAALILYKNKRREVLRS